MADLVDDDIVEASKAPLLDHLIELRRRLIYTFATIIVLFFVCYAFSEHIFNFLAEPLAEIMRSKGTHPRMIYTALHEAFFTYIKVSMFAALFLSFPMIAIQIWKFVAPGLYKNERKAFLPFLIATPVLFFLGGALVYYVIFPLAWRFFLSFEVPGSPGVMPIELDAKVDQYLDLVMRLIFAFGLFFELPVVLTLLSYIGLVTSKGLAKKRKWAILVAFIAAAIMTPPDVISQFGLAVPTLILYEISIISVRIVEKRRGDVFEDEDDDDDDDDEEEPKPAAAPTGSGSGSGGAGAAGSSGPEPPDETDFNLR